MIYFIKAFEKSSSIRSVCLPALVFLARYSNNMVSCVSYDLFALNPCCKSHRRSCFSRCFTMWEAIICSSILQRIQVREEIGL